MSVGGGGRKNCSSPKGGRSDERGLAARLIDRALRSLAQSIAADTCSIVLADRRTGSMVVHSAYGLSEGARRSRGRLGEGVAGYVLRQSRPVLLGDARRDARLKRAAVTPRTDISSSICIPLSFNRTTTGVLSLSRKVGVPPFQPQDVALAASMAAQLRPAVERAIKHGGGRACAGQGGDGVRGQRFAVDDLRRQLREATAMHSAVRRLNASVTLGQVLRELRGAARQILANGAVEEKYLLFARGRSRPGLRVAGGANGRKRASWAAVGRRLTRPVWVQGNNGAYGHLARAITGDTQPVLLIPLRDGKSNVGVAAVRGLSRCPGEHKIEGLAALHAHGAAAIKRAIACSRAARSRSLGLSAVQSLCEKMSKAGSLSEGLSSLLRIAASALPCDSGLLLLRDECSGALRALAARGRRKDLGEWERGIYEWVAAQKRAFLADAVDGFGCLMAVPLVAGNRVIGVIALQGKAGVFTQEHVRMLSILCCQAAAGYRAVQSLGRLSQYTENLLASLVAGVIGVDRDGRVVIWSPAAERVLGYPAALAVGQPLDQVMDSVASRSGCPAVAVIGQIGLQAVGDKGRTSCRELTCETSGGKVSHLSISCSPVQTRTGERVGAVLLVDDVTERKRLQNQMQQVQQLAALGHMAAKVAHEVRNPLSAIKAAAQLLSEEANGKGLVGQLSRIIDEECDRLRKLTSDFLAYARPATPRADEVQVGDVVRRCLRLMQADLRKKGIAVSLRMGRSLPRVEADAEQLEQVFMNLITNAAQAMEGGGRLGVCVRLIESDGRHLVETSVKDTGPGVPAECLDKIFEPFFTTKTRGTGLGLSIARQIVEAHEGEIVVSTRPGQGSNFRVRIPVERTGLRSNGGGEHGARG